MPQKDDYHKLNRHGQCIILRLRTGHKRLRSHMYTKFKVGNSPMCSCGTTQQTAEHVLQNCAQLEDIRLRYWPTSTSLNVKLYGGVGELEKTVGYILDTGLSV